jgi:hypothetical protein
MEYKRKNSADNIQDSELVKINQNTIMLSLDLIIIKINVIY